MAGSKVSRAEWRARVERWKSSGLSAAAFAAKTGCSAKSLSWWSWKLGREDQAPPVAESRALVPFVEVSAVTAEQCRLEVEVAGATIRVPPEFDAVTLSRLIATLEARR